MIFISDSCLIEELEGLLAVVVCNVRRTSLSEYEFLEVLVVTGSFLLETATLIFIDFLIAWSEA
jgi:hypothetical protein